MNIDIRLSLGFFDHPKTRKLKKRLGLEGVVCLLKLWAWTAGNRPGGVLTGLDAEAVELAAGWDGEDGALVAVLGELRLLDEDGGVFAVHDWETHQAYASKSEERSSKARRAAEARWNRTAGVSGDTGHEAVGMPDAARGAARNMREAAASMPGACGGQCPRNQEPETGNQDGDTPSTPAYPAMRDTRAHAGGAAGEGGDSCVGPGVGPGGDSGGEGAVGPSAGPAVGPGGDSRGDSRGEGAVGPRSGPQTGPQTGPASARARPRTDAPGKGTPEWAAFLSCWDVYPVRQGKEAAWREWMRLHGNRTLAPAWVIREAILRLSAEDSRWRRGMAPNFAKWLDGKGWEDEPYLPPGAGAGAEAAGATDAQARRAAEERRRTFAALREQSERLRYGAWPRGAAAGGVQ